MIYQIQYSPKFNQLENSGYTQALEYYLIDKENTPINVRDTQFNNLYQRIDEYHNHFNDIKYTHYDSDCDLLFTISEVKDIKQSAIEEGKFWAIMHNYSNRDCEYKFTSIGRQFGLDDTSIYTLPLFYLEQYYKLKDEVTELKKDLGNVFKPVLEKYDVTVVSNDWSMENYVPGIKSVEITRKKEQN